MVVRYKITGEENIASLWVSASSILHDVNEARTVIGVPTGADDDWIGKYLTREGTAEEGNWQGEV